MDRKQRTRKQGQTATAIGKRQRDDTLNELTARINNRHNWFGLVSGNALSDSKQIIGGSNPPEFDPENRRYELRDCIVTDGKRFRIVSRKPEHAVVGALVRPLASQGNVASSEWTVTEVLPIDWDDSPIEESSLAYAERIISLINLTNSYINPMYSDVDVDADRAARFAFLAGKYWAIATIKRDIDPYFIKDENRKQKSGERGGKAQKERADSWQRPLFPAISHLSKDKSIKTYSRLYDRLHKDFPELCSNIGGLKAFTRYVQQLEKEGLRTSIAQSTRKNKT